MKIFRLDKLIKISVLDFRKNMLYEVLPEKYNWWGKVIQKAGIYHLGYGYFYGNVLPEGIIETNIIVENEVLKIPKVILYFENGIEYEKHFDTLDEANKWAEEIIRGDKKWIIII